LVFYCFTIEVFIALEIVIEVHIAIAFDIAILIFVQIFINDEEFSSRIAMAWLGA
jgi:hypothetical protein